MGRIGGIGSDDSDKDRLIDAYLEDIPMGAPCKADYLYEFKLKLNILEESGIDLSRKTLDEVKIMKIPKKIIK